MLHNLASLLLMGPLGVVGVIFAGFAFGGADGFFVKKFLVDKKIGDANITANKIVEDAKSEARNLKKEAIIEAKEEVHKLRSEFDRESKERRNEIQKTEMRILQKEENLDKKEESLDKKLEEIDNQRKGLSKKESDLAKKENEVKQAHTRIVEELEKVAKLSKEEAKEQLVEEMKVEAQRTAAVLVREIEAEAKENAEKKAKNIIGLAIQRNAAEYTAETTVSVVPLPNDDMKGRIIGREGRNIKAIENATGVDLIIDDTPEVVVLSSFDPVKREIARITLEKLIMDGRIHPARVEEMVEKVKNSVENEIKEAGEQAAFETGIIGLHPEVIKLLGRLKYRTSYGQNVLVHSIEVAKLAGTMAEELGVDPVLAKRGGLLHDIGKAVDHEVEGTHIQIGYDLAKKYKENANVLNCIQAHHGDVEPTTVEAILVAAADAISGSRPGARRETLEIYVKRLEKLEEIANSFTGVEKSFAVQAGREIRVIVKPESIDDAQALFMAKDIAKKIEEELDYPGQIKVNVIREFRGVEFAK